MIQLFVTLAVGILAWVISQVYASTLAAWITLISLYLVLLQCGLAFVRDRGFWGRLFTTISLAVIAGISAAGLGQIESRFSDDEFYSAIQALMMSVYWGFLFVLYQAAQQRWPSLKSIHASASPLKIGVFLAICCLSGSLALLNAYQSSFYPLNPPIYSGISLDSPFLCGTAPADAQVYDGEAVFQQLLDLIAANPEKSTPEFGMLALFAADPGWKQEFRTHLLEEMQADRFTTPSNSVKYSQYEAALRVYYYIQVKKHTPGLFTLSEDQAIRRWFTAINRRAWNVEWIDWLYALAYNQLPRGVFENQEIGAGLLSLMEVEGLGDPALSERNRAYLNAQPRGWQARFRNTDDTIDYQQEWIYNALFQSQLSGLAAHEATQRSFDSLWLQALPDGSPLQVNHPVPLVQTGIAYLGASLLQDARLLWISGRSVDYFSTVAGKQTAVPGVEAAIKLTGMSPLTGTCLLYGDSGIHTRSGPLAPDKIVFRDGWSVDSTYMLVNLRFTGWHRYKASGTITRVYQAGELAREQLQGESANWLPAGRSMFRDKRIPRQNLNGLLIERSGMGAVLYRLTGLGTRWAQDPPFYARVESFQNREDLDYADIRIENWHGWDHSRKIFFYHQGPIVIFDQAHGPSKRRAALSWQLSSSAILSKDRILLRPGSDSAEFLLIPLEEQEPIPALFPTMQDFQVQYQSPSGGSLATISVFLTREWIGASWSLNPVPDGWEFSLQKGERHLTVRLPLED